ncbi:MAG: hypothetical protein AAF320_03070 [Myxococcota bacterium]
MVIVLASVGGGCGLINPSFSSSEEPASSPPYFQKDTSRNSGAANRAQGFPNQAERSPRGGKGSPALTTPSQYSPQDPPDDGNPRQPQNRGPQQEAPPQQPPHEPIANNNVNNGPDPQPQPVQQQQFDHENPNNNGLQANHNPNHQQPEVPQDPPPQQPNLPQREANDVDGQLMDQQNMEFQQMEEEQRQRDRQQQEDEERRQREEQNAEVAAFMRKTAQGIFVKHERLQDSLRDLPQMYQGFEDAIRNNNSVQEFVFHLMHAFARQYHGGDITQVDNDQFTDALGQAYGQLRNFQTMGELAADIANRCLQGDLCNGQQKLHFATAVLLLHNHQPAENNFLSFLNVIIGQGNNANQERRDFMVNTVLRSFQERTGGVVGANQLVAFLQALDPVVAYRFLNAKAQTFYTNWQHEFKAHVRQAQAILQGQPDGYIQPDERGALRRLDNFLRNQEPDNGWMGNNMMQNNRIEGQRDRFGQHVNTFNAFVTAFAQHLNNQVTTELAAFFYVGGLLH